MSSDGPTRRSLGGKSKIALPKVGHVLKEYRENHGLTQGALADLLNVHQSTVSKIESGKVVRDVEFLLRIAQVLDVPLTHLGLSKQLVRTADVGHTLTSAVADATVHSEPCDSVAVGQDEWRGVRRYLNQHRHELAREAVGLYEPRWRLARTPLMAPEEWLPAEPVRIEDVSMEWTAEHANPLVTGTEPEAFATRPMRRPGHQFDRYTAAIRYIDPPTLFENRPSYQMLGLHWSSDGGSMRFGLATYFDKLDVAEALGHELAQASLRVGAGNVSMRDLQFRTLVGDPFDMTRRAILPAVTTLTLRRRTTHGTATFLLHWRDPSKVATAAGVYDVIPAGEFQPSSVAVWDQRNDFDIWRSIVREFSEELLGEPEHDGSSGVPVDYGAWPLYRTLQAARSNGKVTAYCLGAGVDALTLAPTILTVVVIDDDVFDQAFRDVVDVNAEGVVVFGDSADAKGLPFEDKTVRQMLENEPMASPGAACLSLAWRHRMALLAP